MRPVGGYPQSGPPARRSLTERVAAASDRGLVGVFLAVAGVGVTLIGIVLLLVLAAQAGILRPELRVAAGAVLAGALVGAGLWWRRKPNGRVGAIALAATGIAAGYLDVAAATRIYHWLPAVAGLVVAAAVAAGGLILTRRWDSEHLGLLVIVPLTLLAPFLTDGVNTTLIAFMLVLSAATLWVHLGRDWIVLFAVRTAAPTLPLFFAAAGAGLGTTRPGNEFVVAAVINAVLAVSSAVLLMQHSRFHAWLALVSVASMLPIALSGVALDTTTSALLTAGGSAALLTLAIVGRWSGGVPHSAQEIWLATSLGLALIAVVDAFDAAVAVPVILVMALIAVLAADADEQLGRVWRWAAAILGVIGVLSMLAQLRPVDLGHARDISVTAGMTTLISAALAILVAVGLVRMWRHDSSVRMDSGIRTVAWGLSGIVIAYAVTAFTVTAASMIAGGDSGFLAGHVLATVCWMIMAAAVMVYARRLDASARTPLVTGALCLVAAAMAKLFLFDLAALDGIFRVLVFLVTGLILLAMGAWYARTLDATNGESVSAQNGCDATTPGR